MSLFFKKNNDEAYMLRRLNQPRDRVVHYYLYYLINVSQLCLFKKVVLKGY